MRRLPLLLVLGLLLAAPATAGAQALAPYQGFLLSTTTPLGATDGDWSFVAGDVNRDGAPDLVAIDRQDAGSSSTAVHVLDGAASFQRFLVETGTALPPSGPTWSFAMADFNGDGVQDLWGISRAGTGTGRTEVHVLDGATGFKTFLEQTGTALHETPDGWAFGVSDVNRDGRPDLVGFSRRGASGSTEVHVLDGSTHFDRFLVQTPTALAQTDERFDLGLGDATGDGVDDVLAVDRRDPGSNRTAISVLDGAQGFKPFASQTATVLGPTDAAWSFVPAAYTRDRLVDVLAVARGAQTSVAVLDGALRPVPPPETGPGRCGPAGGLALTAAASRGVVRFGARPRVTGRLTRTDGTPVAGTSVELSQGLGAFGLVGTAVTGPDGRWGFDLPAGASRDVYAAVSDGDTTPVCSGVLRQLVRAGAVLRVSRKHARNGARVRFTGRLKGVAVAGRRIDVQGYQPRLRKWIGVSTRTTRADGRFTAGYRFVATRRPTTYRFRVLVRAQEGLPYARGTSRTVKVRVRP